MTVSREDRMASPVRALGVAVLALGILGGLVWAGPDLGELERMAADPQGYVDAVGADRAAVALAGAAGWVLLGWLSVGLLLTAASTMPGLAGRIFGFVAGCVVPAVVRRAVTLALGVSVVTGVAAHAEGTAVVSMPAGQFAIAVDWPVAPAEPAEPLPAELADQGVPAPPPAAQPADPVHAGATVVEPGDTLWGIAATRLGPAAGEADIAASMRAWYAANHEVIGADPDLIHPGQVLVAPPGGPP